MANAAETPKARKKSAAHDHDHDHAHDHDDPPKTAK